MEVFIKISQFILCLSLLIVIHELGHFLFARLFKVRVEKFYLFFNPWVTLFRAKRVNKKWQAVWFSKSAPESWKDYPETTEWGVGWLPLGGYCKIAGMIDESMDLDQMKQPAQPWEFRTKPAWQRLLIMIGGVMFNIIFAMLIYSGMLFTWGESYIDNKNVVHGIACGPLADSLGLKNGDKIVAIDGKEVVRFEEIPIIIIRDQASSLTVDRNGEQLNIPIDADFRRQLRRSKSMFVDIQRPFVIDSFQDASPAKEAGLEVGDRVVAIDGVETPYFNDVKSMLTQNPNQQLSFTVQRGDNTLAIPVNVKNGLIGVAVGGFNDVVTHVEYGFFESIPKGIAKGWREVGNYLKNLRLIFSPQEKAYSEVGGFIMIANVFPSLWDWHSFWTLCALLSIMLAVVNLLPIPMLDGGHVLFLLYEVVTKRKPSDKFMEYAQYVGFLIVIALVLFANGNDVIKLFK